METRREKWMFRWWGWGPSDLIVNDQHMQLSVTAENSLPKQSNIVIPQSFHTTSWLATTNSPACQIANLFQSEGGRIKRRIELHGYCIAKSPVSSLSQELTKPVDAVLLASGKHKMSCACSSAASHDGRFGP